MQATFLNSGGFLAVFRTVFQAIDATPNYFFAVPCPSDPTVLSTAVTAAEKLGKRILAAIFSSLCLNGLALLSPL